MILLLLILTVKQYTTYNVRYVYSLYDGNFSSTDVNYNPYYILYTLYINIGHFILYDSHNIHIL